MALIDRFNNEFTAWAESSGCQANLAWGYEGGKHLKLVSVSYPVFHKEAPSAQTLGEALKSLETQ